MDRRGWIHDCRSSHYQDGLHHQRVDYIEAMELCNFGAKVIILRPSHPVCIKNIPIRVKTRSILKIRAPSSSRRWKTTGSLSSRVYRLSAARPLITGDRPFNGGSDRRESPHILQTAHGISVFGESGFFKIRPPSVCRAGCCCRGGAQR